MSIFIYRTKYLLDPFISFFLLHFHETPLTFCGFIYQIKFIHHRISLFIDVTAATQARVPTAIEALQTIPNSNSKVKLFFGKLFRTTFHT